MVMGVKVEVTVVYAYQYWQTDNGGTTAAGA